MKRLIKFRNPKNRFEMLLNAMRDSYNDPKLKPFVLGPEACKQTEFRAAVYLILSTVRGVLKEGKHLSNKDKAPIYEMEKLFTTLSSESGRTQIKKVCEEKYQYALKVAGRLISGLVFFKIWSRVPTPLQTLTFTQVRRTLQTLFEGTDHCRVNGLDDDHLNNVSSWAMAIMCRLRDGDLEENKIHARDDHGNIK